MLTIKEAREQLKDILSDASVDGGTWLYEVWLNKISKEAIRRRKVTRQESLGA